jgi:hypothetical protein
VRTLSVSEGPVVYVPVKFTHVLAVELAGGHQVTSDCVGLNKGSCSTFWPVICTDGAAHKFPGHIMQGNVPL